MEVTKKEYNVKVTKRLVDGQKRVYITLPDSVTQILDRWIVKTKDVEVPYSDQILKRYLVKKVIANYLNDKELFLFDKDFVDAGWKNHPMPFSGSYLSKVLRDIPSGISKVLGITDKHNLIGGGSGK